MARPKGSKNKVKKKIMKTSRVKDQTGNGNNLVFIRLSKSQRALIEKAIKMLEKLLA